MAIQRLLLLAVAWAALALSTVSPETTKAAGVGAVAAAALTCDPRLLARLVASSALLPGVLALALAAACALEPAVALVGSVDRAQGLLAGISTLLLAGAAAGLTPESRRRVYCGVAALGGAMAAYALAQRLGLDPIVWHGVPDRRPTATLGNANVLGGWLLLTLPLTLLARRAGGFAWPLSALLQVLALLASGTRGAWLSLLAVALLLPLLDRRRWRVLLLLPLLAGFAAALASWRPESLQDRAFLWRTAMQALREPPELIDLNGAPDSGAGLRPWTGYGPDQQRAVLLAAQSQAPAVRADAAGWEADRAHQVLLDRLLETGAAGLLATLVAALSIGAAMRRALRDPLVRTEARWLGLALAAWALHLQAGFALTGDRTLGWICVGLLLGLTARPAGTVAAGKLLRATAGVMAGALLLLAAAAIGLVPETWRQHLAPAQAAEAAFVVGQAGYALAQRQPGSGGRAGFAAAAQAFEQAASLRPYDRDAARAAASARIEEAAADLSTAVPALDRAEHWIRAVERLDPGDPRMAAIRERAAEVRSRTGP